MLNIWIFSLLEEEYSWEQSFQSCVRPFIQPVEKTKHSETPASHLRGSSRWSWCAGRACRWRSARDDLSLAADSGTRSPDWAWPWWAAAGRWCPARRRPTGAPTPEPDWSLCTGSVLPSSEPLRTRGRKGILHSGFCSDLHRIHLWSFKIKVFKFKFYCCFSLNTLHFGVFPSKQLSKSIKGGQNKQKATCAANNSELDLILCPTF